MRQELKEDHRTDPEGNPTGGYTTGTGIDIKWQDGPLGRGADRIEPNGAFVEGVIQAAVGRLRFYQGSRCSDPHNQLAIRYLMDALGELDERTRERTWRGVEGTHNA